MLFADQSGVNQIAMRLSRIWPPSVVGNTAIFKGLVFPSFSSIGCGGIQNV